MSDIIPFESGQLPAHLKGVEDSVTKALAGNRGSGFRISIKGGVWRMLDGGKEVAKNEDRTMKVVIVNCAPKNARSFYKDKYVEGGDHKPPTCWSNDGDKPEADVKDKQSPSCATCPQNVKGSGQGESRACRYSRHLAVMLPNDIQQGRVYKLTLPATSIFGEGDANKKELPLEAYAAMLRGMGVPVTGVITQMKFDTSVSTPKITFWPVGYLNSADFDLANKMGTSKEALEAITTTVFAQDNGGSASTPAPASTSVPAGDTTPTEGEPEVVAAVKPVGAAPASTAALLSQWDD